MEKTYSELLMLLAVWSTSFVGFLLFIFVTRKNNKKYNNPSIIKVLLPLSIATTVGMFALVKLLAVLFISEYVGNTVEVIAFAMAFVVPDLFLPVFLISRRTSKNEATPPNPEYDNGFALPHHPTGETPEFAKNW
jgi:hypothetical protein